MISKTTAIVAIALIIILACAIYGDEARSVESLMSIPTGYPIDSTVATTLNWTILPVAVPSTSPMILPTDISLYSLYGYGLWQFGAGLDYVKRLDLMPSSYTGASVTKKANLLHFFAMTDIHITDEETPAGACEVGYKGGNSSGYASVMLYSTQVLDAAIQTVNAIHKTDPFDFGIGIGDAINNTQYNELRWYIDVFDGKVITPDSGDKDDPVPGPLNDYQDSFKAAGLDKSIPWYQTLGNHDHFGMGGYPVTDAIRQVYTGLDMLNMGNIFTDPAGVNATGYYMGAIDGRTPLGTVYGAGPLADFPNGIPQVLSADPDRRSLTRKEWMNEFFTTSSMPVGHGFSQANVDDDFACYTFEPKSDVPIRVIVLDDTQKDEDFDVRGHGYLDAERYVWLINELDKGQAEGKLMIISAHIPLLLMGFPPKKNSVVNSRQLLTKLSSYSNLILWIAGHRHRNVITPRPSIDPAYSGPQYGFWEVETASLRDFPQQFRTFNIVRNSDNTISIFTTDVDPAVKAGSPAAISRSYAVASMQIFHEQSFLPPSEAYNAELVKQLDPQLFDSIAPTVAITNPTTAAAIARNCPTLTMSGTASDNKGVASLTWANSANSKTGDCNYDGTSWSVEKISLVKGENPITITASDAAGNKSTAIIKVTYVNSVPGTAWKGLAMVSLPIIPDQSNPMYEVRFYEDGWCSFIPNLNEYSVYPDTRCWLQPAENTPGRGFWARFQSAAIPYGNIPDQTQPVSIHLLPGWNLIGNPFVSAVKWDLNAIRVQESDSGAVPLKSAGSLVCSYAWGWNQSTTNPNTGSYDLIYDAAAMLGVTSTLTSWQGYWIKAFKECNLILPAPITRVTTGRKTSKR